jgi:hypothetical protein
VALFHLFERQLQPRIGDPPLRRCVFVIGARQLRNDIDDAAGDLELDTLTALIPALRRTLRGAIDSLLDVTTDRFTTPLFAASTY